MSDNLPGVWAVWLERDSEKCVFAQENGKNAADTEAAWWRSLDGTRRAILHRLVPAEQVEEAIAEKEIALNALRVREQEQTETLIEYDELRAELAEARKYLRHAGLKGCRDERCVLGRPDEPITNSGCLCAAREGW